MEELVSFHVDDVPVFLRMDLAFRDERDRVRIVDWKTGRRATAMTFSAATFSQKLGGALGSAGVLWVLASVGYAANQIQEGASLESIVWLQTLVPAFFAFVSVACLKFYDLSAAKLQQIQAELEERNKNQATE